MSGNKDIRSQAIMRLATMVIIAVALFLLPGVWSWSGLYVVIIAAFVILTFFLVRWHARRSGYQCPACDYTFAISAVTDFFSPHLGGVKLLRCPRCSQSSWCREIGRDAVSHARIPARLLPAGSFEGATSLRMQMILVFLIYCTLWAYTLYAWPSLPEGTSSWRVLKIPLAILILPLLHLAFCLFGVYQGYRSRMYMLVSIFVIVFLLLALWIQYSILGRLS